MSRTRCTVWLLLFALSVAVGPARASEIHLSAAASLKDALNEISDGFCRKHGGAVRIVRNYGASGSLAMQVESGAPVDIFVSANEIWLSYLTQKGMLSPLPVRDLAYNSLVFVGRPGVHASSLKDLLRLERIAIGSPKSVPAGEYAMEALRNAYIDRQLQGKLVMARDVRECLMYAERGEVDGALVYRTDALEAKKAKILFSVPQNLYHRVNYPMALTLSGARNHDAEAFFSYLQGKEARAVLVRYGFLVR